MDIDELLDSSAPLIAPRSGKLDAAVLDMVRASRTVTLRRNRRLRSAVVGLATIVVGFGGYAQAAANGWVPAPFDWMGDGGRECTSQLTFIAFDDGGGEPMTRDWPYERRRADDQGLAI